MPKTKGRGKVRKRRTIPRRPPPGPRWDAVDAALRRAGLLTELPVLGPDATDDFEPVVVRGEPLSASLIRERR